MINQEIMKNILAYQKAGFENAYNSAVTIHQKTQGWIDETLAKAPYFPEPGKMLVDSWMNTIKETRDGFKQYVNEQQAQIEAFLSNNS